MKLGIESFKLFSLKKNCIFVLDHLQEFFFKNYSPKKKKEKKFLKLISFIFEILKKNSLILHDFSFSERRKKKEIFFWELTKSTRGGGGNLAPLFLVFSFSFFASLFFLLSSTIVTIHLLLPLEFCPSLHHFISRKTLS